MYNKGWRKIEGHPNYEINHAGEVRNKRALKILKPYDDSSGYLRVTQSENIKHAWETDLFKRG